MTRKGVIYRPIAHVYLMSKGGIWYLFYPYVDSGADVSLFTRSDAELLEIELYKGEYRPVTGIGRVVIPSYVHEVKIRIGDIVFRAKISFADSDEEDYLVERIYL